MSNLIVEQKELAVRAVNDIQAFSELYEYYFPRVYNYIFAKVGERDATDELTSQVFEKIVSKINMYNPEHGAFSTWLFRIAQNTMIDYYRKNKKNLVSFADQAKEIPSNDSSIDELMILDEDKKNLMNCLSSLSDRDRNIIALKFWSQLSNQEIAEIVNESSNHVAVILYRSIKRLKILMMEQEAG